MLLGSLPPPHHDRAPHRSRRRTRCNVTSPTTRCGPSSPGVRGQGMGMGGQAEGELCPTEQDSVVSSSSHGSRTWTRETSPSPAGSPTHSAQLREVPAGSNRQPGLPWARPLTARGTSQNHPAGHRGHRAQGLPHSDPRCPPPAGRGLCPGIGEAAQTPGRTQRDEHRAFHEAAPACVRSWAQEEDGAWHLESGH